MTSVERRADLRTSASAIAALVPGFVLPFVITLRLSAESSDAVFLALSIMSTFVSTVVAAIEMNTISEFGRHSSGTKLPSREILKDYSRRIYQLSFPMLLVLSVVLTAIYWRAGYHADWNFITVCALISVVPAIGIPAAIRSGLMISMGNVVLPILSQMFRPTLGILILVAWNDAPLLVLCGAFVFGELIRFIVLLRASASIVRGGAMSGSDRMETSGLYWQSGSMAVSQGAPIVDRVFLSGASAGSVSMYEIADKLFYAAVQLLNYGMLSRRVGRWSRIHQHTRVEAGRVLIRDLTVLLLSSTVICVLGSFVLWFLRRFPLPLMWSEASVWASVALLCLPFTMWILAISRLVVIARAQQFLIYFSVGTIAVNLALDVLMYAEMGAFGIIVATLVCRVLSAVAYFILFVVQLKSRILPPADC